MSYYIYEMVEGADYPALRSKQRALALITDATGDTAQFEGDLLEPLALFQRPDGGGDGARRDAGDARSIFRHPS